MEDFTVLSDSSNTIDGLSSKYKGLAAPAFDIKVEGTSLISQHVMINSLTVDTSMEKADTCSFVVTNAFNPVAKEFTWLDNYLSIGKAIEISTGYTDVKNIIFSGFITSVRIEMNSTEQILVTVSGIDNSFRLMRGVKSRVFVNVSDSDVATQVINGAGLTARVDSISTVNAMVQQVGITDYQFLRQLAERNGFEMFVSGKEVHFRNTPTSGDSAVTLTWGQTLKSLYKEDDLHDQTGTVTVRSWDPKTKAALVATANTTNKIGAGSDGKTILEQTLGTVEDHYFSEARTLEQLTAEAKAIKHRSAMKLVSGEATCVGIPELRAGQFVQLAGLGVKLSRQYYVTAARHSIDADGYITTLKLGGSAL